MKHLTRTHLESLTKHVPKNQLESMYTALFIHNKDRYQTGAYLKMYKHATQVQPRDVSLEPTKLLATMPSPMPSHPHTDALSQQQHTDKYDLRDIALPKSLTDLIQTFLNLRRQLPCQIRINDRSAKLLSDAGFCQNGYFTYGTLLIPLIPDANLDLSTICLDH